MPVHNRFIVAVDRHGQELGALFDAGTRRITVAGGTAELPPGWEPAFIYTGFAPVYLMELRHVDGHESTWFLDEKLDRLTYDHPERVPGIFATILRHATSRLAETLWDDLLSAADPTFGDELAAFFSLGVVIRRRLAAFRGNEPVVNLRRFDLADIASPLALRLGPDVLVQTERATAALRQNWMEQATGTLAAGEIAWISPTGSGLVGASTGVWLNDYILAYRMIDQGRPIYVFVSGSKSRPVGFLLPAERTLLAMRSSEFESYFNRLLGISSDQALIAHLFEYGDLLPAAWSAPAEGFSVVCRELFFGTQLWHDLTGLDSIVRRVPPGHLPEIIGWSVSEIFGRTDSLFPELYLNRKISNTDSLIRYAYSEKRCLLGLTDDYVTTALRERLLRVNLSDAAGLNGDLENARRSGAPLVLLGLRVENRTIVDLAEFFGDVIDYLVLERGAVSVVIDGHNGDSQGGTYGTSMERGISRTPIDVERDIVSALRSRFHASPVTIIDNIGAPVSHSIFWCHHADFFITPFGTGLAKYRWVCNKAGLVIAGQWTLLHQEHLHIYEERHLEAPAPLHFMPEAFVRDDPDAPVLVPYPGNPPDRWNYHVDRLGMPHELQWLLQVSPA